MLYKNILMKIRRSFGRYISILIIVLVGVGFCSGILATSPNIIKTGDEYFKEQNLMNFKIVSTLGLTEDDVKAIESLEEVKDVYPSYSLDVLNEGKPIRVHAFEKSINEPLLVDGRLPEKGNECVGDSKTYNIGDKITITSDVSEDMKNLEFTVVGTVDSVLYLTDNYGSTNIGDGKLSSFIFVNKENFTIDVYTEIYVIASWNESVTAYSKEYDSLSSKLNDTFVAMKTERENARYDEIYNEANDEILENEAKLNDERAKGEKELADAKRELDENAVAIENARDEIAQNEALMQMAGITDPSLEAAKLELDENAEKVYEGYIEYEENLDKFNTEIKDAEEKIADGKKELSEIERAKWNIFDRELIADYNILRVGTNTITSIAVVFPIFFMLIVMLMTSNTMARMIEEERGELGTLTSLGYGDKNIVSTYLFYVLSASILGIVAGFFIGCSIIPKIIYACFNFYLPELNIDYDLKTFLFIFIFATAVMILVTVISCNRELKQKPATLLRPVPPKNGQRILIEKIVPIWKHLSFTWKVTMRNMFRFKKRGIMTIVGVAGCTALILMGFGIKDSISGVAEKQYGEIIRYDNFMVLTDETESIDEELENILEKEKIESPVLIKQSAFKLDQNGESMDFFLIVPEDEEIFYKHYNLKKVESDDSIKLSDDGVIITQKLSEVFGAQKGDSISVKDSENNPYTLIVSDITENYASNYVYMNKNMYDNIFEESVIYNGIVSTFKGDEKNLAQNLIDSELVLNVVFTSDLLEKTIESNNSLNSVIVLIVVVASLLAIIVLYNLTSINISERKREIATLKVLGFNDVETNQYIYREAIILTLISIAIGLGLGVVLHGALIGFIEGADSVFFKNVRPMSFIWSALITIVFSLIMQVVTYFKLKDIDMIGSLKSVE